MPPHLLSPQETFAASPEPPVYDGGASISEDVAIGRRAITASHLAERGEVWGQGRAGVGAAPNSVRVVRRMLAAASIERGWYRSFGKASHRRAKRDNRGNRLRQSQLWADGVGKGVGNHRCYIGLRYLRGPGKPAAISDFGCHPVQVLEAAEDLLIIVLDRCRVDFCRGPYARAPLIGFQPRIHGGEQTERRPVEMAPSTSRHCNETVVMLAAGTRDRSRQYA